jgi:O-antigen/teichoic acid export membrane protein
MRSLRVPSPDPRISMDSVARGTLINLATRTLGIALGLLILLTAARLGTAEQGAYALFTAVESSLLMLGSGFGIALARRVSHHGERPAALVGAMLMVCVGVGAVCSLALLALASQGPANLQFLVILAFASTVLFVAPSLSGLWLGTANMTALACLNLAAPLLTLAGIGVALFWSGQISLPTVLWSWASARILVALGAFATAWRQGWIALPKAAALHGEWRFVVVIGLTNLIGLLNYKADLFLVEYFLGRSATGVYSIAVMVAELLWLVSSSVTQAAYARIGTRDHADASRITVRVVHVSLLALLVLTPLLWAVASWVIPWLLGSEYAPSLIVLAWLLPGVVAFGAASPLSAYFTNHAGRPLIAAGLAAFSLLVNVLLSVLLIPLYGLIGGALATTLSYLLSISVSVVVFQRLSGTPLRNLAQPNWQALAADLRRLVPRVSRAG